MSPYRLQEQRKLAPAIFCGAGDGARTRYLHLGKVALYQMSYARKYVPLAHISVPLSKDLRVSAPRAGCADLALLKQGLGCHIFVCLRQTKLVPPVGIEPTTRGFSVRCSTN